MKAVVALSLLSAVQAAFTETVNGVTYTVTHLDADGSELPVEFGPDLSSISREPQRATRRSGKSVKRDQTFNNWCGASNIDPPGGAFNEVEGSWTVPNISLRQGQTDYDQPSLVQWVGIDGDGCNSGLIQGGSGSQVFPPLPSPSLQRKRNILLISYFRSTPTATRPTLPGSSSSPPPSAPFK